MSEVRYDEVGYWTEIKLDILKDYATEYSKIMAKQKSKKIIRKYIYIDAFAGGRYSFIEEYR